MWLWLVSVAHWLELAFDAHDQAVVLVGGQQYEFSVARYGSFKVAGTRFNVAVAGARSASMGCGMPDTSRIPGC